MKEEPPHSPSLPPHPQQPPLPLKDHHLKTIPNEESQQEGGEEGGGGGGELNEEGE